MAKLYVIYPHRLLSIVTRVSQIWHVVRQIQLEFVLAIHRGLGIPRQKLANV